MVEAASLGLRDNNAYTVLPSFVGESVHVHAYATTVRVVCDGSVVAEQAHCWERRRAPNLL